MFIIYIMIDTHVGKVELIMLPNNSRPRYRWIIEKREDGRYLARKPKIGVLLRDLNKKLDKDYNVIHLLPKDFTFWKGVKKSKTNKSKTNKSKTNKSKTNKSKTNKSKTNKSKTNKKINSFTKI
jgi:hypothetical protein